MWEDRPVPVEERAGGCEVSEPEASMSMWEDRPVSEGCKSLPAEWRTGESEVSEPEASMSMSVTEWSKEPEAGIKIGVHSGEVLLRGKPVMEVHHGRSSKGSTSLPINLTRQLAL